MSKIFAYIVVALALFCVTISCDNTEPNMRNLLIMNAQYDIPVNCDFNKIYDEYISNECSPVINDVNYVGLVINVRRTTNLSDQMKIPLACSFAHDVAVDLKLSKPFENSIIFVAINKETNEIYSSSVRDIENRVQPPRKSNMTTDNVNSALVKKIVRGSVNIELIDLLRLPRKVASYHVYATVAVYKSNVIDIEVLKSE